MAAPTALKNDRWKRWSKNSQKRVIWNIADAPAAGAVRCEAIFWQHAILNMYSHEHLKQKQKKTLIKTNAQKGSVLPLCHPLLAITGWMRRRRRCRDAERRPGTETWNDHRIDSQYTDGCKLNTETTLTCLNRDPALVPDVGRHVDRSPPSISPKRRLTESGPSPRLQTPDGQQEGGLRWQRKAPPPLHRLSQSHCRVIYKQESLHDASEGLGS